MKYNKIDEIIGNKIFEARVVKRITQDDMASRISSVLEDKYKEPGITRQAYSFYERGSRSMPQLVFSTACKLLGLNDVEVFNNALEEAKIKEVK